MLVLCPPIWRKEIIALIGGIRTVFKASTLDEARSLIARAEAFDAWAVSATNFPDGDAFQLLEEISPRPPTLMFFDALEPARVNRAVALGAVAAAWPAERQTVRGFLDHVDSAAAHSFAIHAGKVQRRAELSAREASVYKLVMMGSQAKEIAKIHGVEESTIRTQVGQVLRKLDEPNIDTMRSKTLRLLLGGRKSER